MRGTHHYPAIADDHRSVSASGAPDPHHLPPLSPATSASASVQRSRRRFPARADAAAAATPLAFTADAARAEFRDAPTARRAPTAPQHDAGGRRDNSTGSNGLARPFAPGGVASSSSSSGENAGRRNGGVYGLGVRLPSPSSPRLAPFGSLAFPASPSPNPIGLMPSAAGRSFLFRGENDQPVYYHPRLLRQHVRYSGTPPPRGEHTVGAWLEDGTAFSSPHFHPNAAGFDAGRTRVGVSSARDRTQGGYSEERRYMRPQTVLPDPEGLLSQQRATSWGPATKKTAAPISSPAGPEEDSFLPIGRSSKLDRFDQPRRMPATVGRGGASGGDQVQLSNLASNDDYSPGGRASTTRPTTAPIGAAGAGGCDRLEQGHHHRAAFGFGRHSSSRLRRAAIELEGLIGPGACDDTEGGAKTEDGGVAGDGRRGLEAGSVDRSGRAASPVPSLLPEASPPLASMTKLNVTTPGGAALPPPPPPSRHTSVHARASGAEQQQQQQRPSHLMFRRQKRVLGLIDRVAQDPSDRIWIIEHRRGQALSLRILTSVEAAEKVIDEFVEARAARHRARRHLFETERRIDALERALARDVESTDAKKRRATVAVAQTPAAALVVSANGPQPSTSLAKTAAAAAALTQAVGPTTTTAAGTTPSTAAAASSPGTTIGETQAAAGGASAVAAVKQRVASSSPDSTVTALSRAATCPPPFCRAVVSERLARQQAVSGSGDEIGIDVPVVKSSSSLSSTSDSSGTMSTSLQTRTCSYVDHFDPDVVSGRGRGHLPRRIARGLSSLSAPPSFFSRRRLSSLSAPTHIHPVTLNPLGVSAPQVHNAVTATPTGSVVHSASAQSSTDDDDDEDDEEEGYSSSASGDYDRFVYESSSSGRDDDDDEADDDAKSAFDDVDSLLRRRRGRDEDDAAAGFAGQAGPAQAHSGTARRVKRLKWAAPSYYYGDEDDRMLWLDIQSSRFASVQRLLERIPRIRPATIENIRDRNAVDEPYNAHQFGYVFCNISAPELEGAPVEAAAARGGGASEQKYQRSSASSSSQPLSTPAAALVNGERLFTPNSPSAIGTSEGYLSPETVAPRERVNKASAALRPSSRTTEALGAAAAVSSPPSFANAASRNPVGGASATATPTCRVAVAPTPVTPAPRDHTQPVFPSAAPSAPRAPAAVVPPVAQVVGKAPSAPSPAPPPPPQRRSVSIVTQGLDTGNDRRGSADVRHMEGGWDHTDHSVGSNASANSTWFKSVWCSGVPPGVDRRRDDDDSSGSETEDTDEDEEDQDPLALDGLEPPEQTVVSLIAMRRWCVTVHSVPFLGLAATMKRAHLHFAAVLQRARQRQKQAAAAQAAEEATRVLRAVRKGPGQLKKQQQHQQRQKNRQQEGRQQQERGGAGPEAAAVTANGKIGAGADNGIGGSGRSETSAGGVSGDGCPSPNIEIGAPSLAVAAAAASDYPATRRQRRKMAAIAALQAERERVRTFLSTGRLPPPPSTCVGTSSISSDASRPGVAAAALPLGSPDGAGGGQVAETTGVAAAANGAPEGRPSSSSPGAAATKSKPMSAPATATSTATTSPTTSAAAAHAPAHVPMLTTPWLVAALVEVNLDATIPDLAPLGEAVDAIDGAALAGVSAGLMLQQHAQRRKRMRLADCPPSGWLSAHNRLGRQGGDGGDSGTQPSTASLGSAKVGRSSQHAGALPRDAIDPWMEQSAAITARYVNDGRVVDGGDDLHRRRRDKKSTFTPRRVCRRAARKIKRLWRRLCRWCRRTFKASKTANSGAAHAGHRRRDRGGQSDPAAQLSRNLPAATSNTSTDGGGSMLVHISHASRVIATYRATLHRKEQLLLSLLSHRMSTTVVLNHAGAEEHYQAILVPLQRAEDRLHALREMLVQAHSNLMTHVSISQAHTANAMMVQMRLLSQVAAVCLPVQILTSLFGVNFLIPYQYGSSEGNRTHAPFYILISFIILWVVVLLPMLILHARRTHATTGI